MHIPQPPPSTSEIAFASNAEAFRGPWIDVYTGKIPDPYLPWDQVRRRTPPPGLTREQYWKALRASRTVQARYIPILTSTDGNPFTFVLTDNILRDTETIAAQAKGQIRSPMAGISQAMRDQYVVSGLVEEAITSSQLEGAVTTRAVAKEMLRARREPRDKSERMILNNYGAMQRIRDLADQELTPDLVCEIHRIVTEGTLDNPEEAGVLQQETDERVGVFTVDNIQLHQPPPAHELQTRLEALCTFANNRDDGPYLPGVLRAVTIHFMMGYNHFFSDGNGRTARALFYWSMLHEGYWLAEFLTISTILKAAPAKYGRSYLDTEQDGGDLTYFYLYHLSVIKRAIDGLYGYVERKNSQARVAQEALKSAPGRLTYRQLEIMSEALESPDVRFTAKELAHTYGVTLQTIRKDLQELTSLGYLTEGKQSRQAVWTPRPDLSRLIQGV